jgi:hypothetical protein
MAASKTSKTVIEVFEGAIPRAIPQIEAWSPAPFLWKSLSPFDAAEHGFEIFL